MHRHVRRVGHQAAVAVEQGAGVVEAFADIDRLRGRPEDLAHLLGDVHEQVVEYLDAGGINRRGERRARRPVILEQQLPADEAPRTPAFFQHHRAVRLDDQRRPRQLPAQRAHGHERHLAPGAEPGAHPLRQLGHCRSFRDGERCGIDRGEARLHAQRLDHHREGVRGKAKAQQVIRVQAPPHLLQGRERNRQRDVAVPGPQLQQPRDPHAPAFTALGGELSARLRFEGGKRGARRGEPGLVEQLTQARAAHGEAVRHADAEGGQHARQRMHENAPHAGGARDAAGVLAGRAPEAEQRELARIAPLTGGYLADGVRHRLDPHLEERFGDPLGAAAGRALRAELGGECGEAARHRVGIDGRAAVAPEERGQGVGPQVPEQHLHVGECQGSVAPIAHRPRVRARGGRADREAAVPEAQHRTAARGDAVHVQHRLGQAHSGNEVLEALRQLAVDQ